MLACSAFIFAFAKSRFSRNEAHFEPILDFIGLWIDCLGTLLLEKNIQNKLREINQAICDKVGCISDFNIYWVENNVTSVKKVYHLGYMKL